jgi:serine/threonine protein kinase/DNA-binding NarL/FixJ family response regulator
MGDANPFNNLMAESTEAATGEPGLGMGAFYGPYQQLHLIGEGAVAEVWRVRHLHPQYDDKALALKLLSTELSTRESIVELFRHEAYLLSLLVHPNIVRTHEAGNLQGRLFIAMDYIQGRDLARFILRCSHMNLMIPINISLHVVSKILNALNYAHNLRNPDDEALDVVHRDVHATNIFLGWNGSVKLGDFGVATVAAGTLNKERAIYGKAGHLAPEQLQRKGIDQRADLFAVGVLLYEMVCQRQLFQAKDLATLLKLNEKAKIPKPRKLNPAISEELEAFLLKSLQRKPRNRFQSAADMQKALSKIIIDHPGIKLGLASLIRQAFPIEFGEDLRLNEELQGMSTRNTQKRQVALVSADDEIRAAIGGLLQARGFAPDIRREFDAQAARCDVCIIDSRCLTDTNFDAPNIQQSIQEPGQRLLLSQHLDTFTLSLGHKIGATDILLRPLSMERVMVALQAALSDQLQVVSYCASSPQPPNAQSCRILAVTTDLNLLTRLKENPHTTNILFEHCPSTQNLSQHLRRRTFHIVLYDPKQQNETTAEFSQAIRSQGGIELLPLIGIVDTPQEKENLQSTVKRCEALERHDPLDSLHTRLTSLIDDGIHGRSFKRYPASIDVQVRYKGTVSQAQTIDLSRNGAMVACDAQIPPIGGEVSLAFRIPFQTLPVEVTGKVSRLMLPQPGNTTSHLGIRFDKFRTDTESPFLDYLFTISQPID